MPDVIQTPFAVGLDLACRRPIVIEMNTEHQVILMALALIAALIALVFTRPRRPRWPPGGDHAA